MTRRALWCLSLGLSFALPKLALAQTETRAAVAEALYRQARDLMAAGNYDEACPKFAQSQQLDPATGTLLNLAACHEKQGKLATAWLEYSDALVAARRDARDDRVEYARQRVQELEPKLSRLTLLLAPDADAPGLTIELDGASVGRAVVGAPTPVDPGKHQVRAAAPGKKPRILELEVGAGAEQKSLLITKLEDAPPDTATPTTAPPTAPAPLQPSSPAPPTDELVSRPVPSSVYIAGGITLALAATASVTGVAYLNKKADYDELAKRGKSTEVETRHDQALTYGRINLGLWIGTAIGAGVTTYLYVTRPAARVSLQLTPLAGPQLAGLVAAGSF
jgi:tetratricopeptide (TPR) repeat protein